jgi:hypothetical protein
MTNLFVEVVVLPYQNVTELASLRMVDGLDYFQVFFFLLVLLFPSALDVPFLVVSPSLHDGIPPHAF